MRINLRYLQSTLEQLIVFMAGLFGLAAYSNGGDAMRAVEATAVVWVLFRFAFWIGYHRATMRSIGAAGVALSLIVLIYVVARISFELAGVIGVAVTLGTFTFPDNPVSRNPSRPVRRDHRLISAMGRLQSRSD